jgi:hypothetical protein
MVGKNCCFSNNDLRRNLVHFDLMFATKVWLVFKSTHFAITLIAILFVTIVVSAKIPYVVTLWMDPNLSHICKYNLWLPQI